MCVASCQWSGRRGAEAAHDHERPALAEPLKRPGDGGHVTLVVPASVARVFAQLVD